MIFEKITEILAEQLDLDKSEITLTSNLVDDLGADSLDAIDIIMSVEDEYQIEVPDEVVESLTTVEDIINFIESKVDTDNIED